MEEEPEIRRKSQKKKCGCVCLLLEVNGAKFLEREKRIKQIPPPQSRLRQMNKITSVFQESHHTYASERMGNAQSGT